jgi:hypothetical protein
VAGFGAATGGGRGDTDAIIVELNFVAKIVGYKFG